MRNWTRRSLLAGGAVLAVPAIGLLAGKLWCRFFVTGPGANASLLPLLKDIHPASAKIRALADKYLSDSGSTAQAALHRVERKNMLVQAVMKGCPNSIAFAIDQTCREDFRLGRVYCIDGWVLSQFELDIAAASTIV